jgi:WD40 repeat protein/serine/threonine protein kinase
VKVEGRIKEIFALALERKAPAEREKYLAEVCQGDPELRREIESLLRAGEQAGDFLGKTMQLPQPDFTVERTGTMIGRYKLLEKIGEGGFGVVYMAEQVEPVQRKVAIKIIKAGRDTREVVARFEAERQALALMDHPNIARVLDAGATEAGRPYFVMELVRGIAITEYCDQKNLSTAERLQLFMKVCHAVQHAHQKGIIHRDLKPNNVLVTLHDGEPVPKVIDFGVAKALGQKLTEKTLFTGFAQMIGTPAYMSPEQAELSGLDIDTRSDIYSLGVLLYELLTGVTTFDTETMRKAALDEIRRMIRETEPLKPSTRLRTLGDKLSEVAKWRNTEPASLSRLVRGDLDWIVMKCLEKDRKRRYETPDALAQDIARHLNNDPVLASPPSVGYLLVKFVRRHRVGVSLGAALAVTVLISAGVSIWQAVRASRQAELAETRRREADSSRQESVEARSLAERSAKAVSHQLARQYVDKGVQRLDDGDYFGSLVWFTEALQLDEGDPESEALQRLRIGAVLKQSPTVLELFRHKDGVVSVEFSADGRRLVTASGDKTARVWDVSTGAPLSPPMEHGDAVISASFSPDGLRVVTASFDHTARIWDASTGAPLTPPMQHASNVWSAAFSPDGRRVVTASEDGTARIWDAATGQPVALPLRHEAAVWLTAFSPDGHFVVTASQDKTARIWDAETGRPVTPALQHTGKVWWATFSPNGRLVATASEDHTARIWDAHTGAPVTPPLQHSEEVIYVAFSPDSQRLVTATGEFIDLFPFDFKDRPGEAQVWDVATGKPVTPAMQHKLSVFHATFSPDGRYVATASRDKTACVWDAKTGAPVTQPLQHQEDVFRAAFSPDGRRLATASFDKAARIWDISNDEQTATELKDSWLAGRFSFSSDGQLIAGNYIGNCARVWNALTGSALTSRLHDTNLYHAALSSDGRLLATAGADNTARIWDAHGGAAFAPPIMHEGKVFWVEFSPDGRQVVTASEDKTARIWDARTGAALTPPLRHASNVLCAAFSPDGRRVVTASEDETARVWDASTGAAMTPPMPHSDGVKLAVFSPDGGRVLTATWDGRTRVWDAHTGMPITPPMKQAGRFIMLSGIESMSFSPDGRRIVIADSDMTARVWDADTGAPITPPLRHGDVVEHAAFSHSGRYVVTASADKTARVWDAATGQPITPPLNHEGSVDCAMFTSDDRALKTVCHGEKGGFKGGFIRSWDLAPDNRPIKDLLLLAQLLSVHRLDASGTLVKLDFDATTNAWLVLPKR